MLAPALLLAIEGDTGIQSHAVNPRRRFTLSFITLEAFPKVYYYILVEIFKIIPVRGLHVADFIDHSLVFLNEGSELFFLIILFHLKIVFYT